MFRYFFLIILGYSTLLNAEQNSIMDEDTLNNESKTNKHFTVGFKAGSHSSNYSKNSLEFNRDIFLELYLKFRLSSEVNSIIAFTYWRAQTKEIETPLQTLPSECINSKGLKLGLDFLLFKIYSNSISLEPSISVEDIAKTENVTFSFGTELKLNIPIWNNRIALLPAVGYKMGAEALDLGGGGIDYSFLSYLVGIEFNIGD